MTSITRQVPTVAAAGMILLSKSEGFGFATQGFQAFALLAASAAVVAVSLLSRYAAAALYFVLPLMAVLPTLFGRDPFTTWFARKDIPEAFWHADHFLRINRHLTGLWAALFAVGAVSGLVPGIFRKFSRTERRTAG